MMFSTVDFPQHLDLAVRSCPLYDAAATRSIEAAALLQHPPQALMARAGLAVARLAAALAPHARQLQVLAGPGNNGGDGLVAARWLHQWGFTIQVSLLGDDAKRPADARWALGEAQRAGVPLSRALPKAVQAELSIDALLGLGGQRAAQGEMAAAMALLNARAGLCLAVDLPSGLHPDTGMPLGTEAVRADHCLSLLTLKPGLFTGAGRDHAGQLWLDALGVAAPEHLASASLIGAQTFRLCRPPRRHVQHKGSFGDVLVLGGAPGMVGAALLAARAALAAGAGRVLLALLAQDPALGVDERWPELMWARLAHALEPHRLADSTVVAGCGGGSAVADCLPTVLRHAARLVLDADALNALALDASLARALRARAQRGQFSVLTPHPLEAARLLGSDTASVQANRLLAAQQLANQLACCVVLKGSGSIVAAAAQRAQINPSGNARLAVGGSGDVLAGWMAGLWAQAPAGLNAAEVAAAAVWSHGLPAQADAAGPAVLAPSRLIERLANLPEHAVDRA